MGGRIDLYTGSTYTLQNTVSYRDAVKKLRIVSKNLKLFFWNDKTKI